MTEDKPKRRPYGASGVREALEKLIDPALTNDLNSALGNTETLKEAKLANIISIQNLSELIRLNDSMEALVSLVDRLGAMISAAIQERSQITVVPEVVTVGDTVIEPGNANAEVHP